MDGQEIKTLGDVHNKTFHAFNRSLLLDKGRLRKWRFTKQEQVDVLQVGCLNEITGPL